MRYDRACDILARYRLVRIESILFVWNPHNSTLATNDPQINPPKIRDVNKHANRYTTRRTRAYRLFILQASRKCEKKNRVTKRFQHNIEIEKWVKQMKDETVRACVPYRWRANLFDDRTFVYWRPYQSIHRHVASLSRKHKHKQKRMHASFLSKKRRKTHVTTCKQSTLNHACACADESRKTRNEHILHKNLTRCLSKARKYSFAYPRSFTHHTRTQSLWPRCEWQTQYEADSIHSCDLWLVWLCCSEPLVPYWYQDPYNIWFSNDESHSPSDCSIISQIISYHKCKCNWMGGIKGNASKKPTTKQALTRGMQAIKWN